MAASVAAAMAAAMAAANRMKKVAPFYPFLEKRRTKREQRAKEQFLLHICQTMHGAKVSRLRNLCTRIFGASCNLFCVRSPQIDVSKGYDYDFDAIRIQTINLCILLLLSSSLSLSACVKSSLRYAPKCETV